jgi:hypothetical protein
MAQTATININLNSKQAQGEIDKLSSSINSAGGSAASLRLELRKTVTELQGLEPGTARFRELSLRAGELRDQIADTNAVVNQLAGNVAERLTKGITGVVSVGVAGFQTLAAGAALFGVESEDLTKTMVRLNALMNLSQALETFSGLDQKITEIRASFQSLTTATVQQTVAQEGENIATAQGTVATTALGVAMKALPIIAIVAGLATLTYGIYSYATANSDAAKEEKKRKENLEKLKKQQEANKKVQEQENESVKQSSVEYVGLVTQLKNTVAGSKERKKQIDEINTTYGTTLKNLSDESAFQEQLNNSIRDYIALQVIKLQQQKNVDKIVASIQAEEDAQKKYNIALGQAKKDADLFNVTFEEFRKGIYTSNDALTAAEIALTKSKLRTQELTLSAEELRKKQLELTEEFRYNGEAIKVDTDAKKDATDATDKYADALEKIKEVLDRQRAAEEGLKEIQDERLSRTSAQVSEELKLIEGFNKEQEELVKVATQREIEALDEKFKQGLVNEEEYKKGREDIQKGGLGNLLQVETDLLNGKRLLLAEDLENVKDKYKLEGEITTQATKQIQDETRLLELQFAKEQEIEAITNSTLTEEKKQEAILAVKKKYIDEEVKLLEQSAKNQIDALGLQKEKQLEDEQLTADQRKQIEEKYNQDVLKVNQTTQTQIQDAINGTKDTQKTALEELEDQISKVQDYLSAIADLYSQFSNTVSMISEARTQQREAEIEGLYAFEKEALENQLTEGLVSREQYENKLLELDQQREQEQQALAREEFETNKRLNIANAIINGAQAVLSTFAGTPGGPIIKSIAAGLAAVFAATQIGVISSQQFTAAGGGIVPGMGSGMVDTVPAMLAPGETVINAQSSSMYPELLNQVNMAGGGISLKPDLPAVNKTDGEMRVFGDNKVDKPIRAYVVETDVTDTQKRVNRIKRSAEF